MRLDSAPLLRWVTTAPRDRSDARAWHRARTDGWVTDDMADKLLLRYANIQLELVYGYHPEEYGPDVASTQGKAEAHPAEPVSTTGRSTE